MAYSKLLIVKTYGSYANHCYFMASSLFLYMFIKKTNIDNTDSNSDTM